MHVFAAKGCRGLEFGAVQIEGTKSYSHSNADIATLVLMVIHLLLLERSAFNSICHPWKALC